MSVCIMCHQECVPMADYDPVVVCIKCDSVYDDGIPQTLLAHWYWSRRRQWTRRPYNAAGVVELARKLVRTGRHGDPATVDELVDAVVPRRTGAPHE